MSDGCCCCCCCYATRHTTYMYKRVLDRLLAEVAQRGCPFMRSQLVSKQADPSANPSVACMLMLGALPISAMMSPAFPGGLGVIGRAAHNPPPGNASTNFIVWIEPERVSPGSYLSIHYPEKLLGGSLVNLGDKNMRDYIIEFVSTAVEEFELDTFRTDFNINPLGNWRQGDTALAKQLTPPPPPGPPARTCPKFTTVPKADIPAGKWGPPGTSDICEFTVANMSVEQCAAACCAEDGKAKGSTRCRRYVYDDAGKAPMIEGACPGKAACNSLKRPDGSNTGCCFLKGGEGLQYIAGGFTAGSVENDPIPPNVQGVSMGVTENKYNHGLYEYWDAVRHRGAQLNPAFAIDNCASGGNRIDLESLVRTVFLWRNDLDNDIMYAGRDPVDQQADTIGLSQFAPISNGNIHCKNYPPAPDMTKTALDGYIWRGASMTGGGIHSSEDFWNWVLGDIDRVATLQAAVEERKELRHLAISGDYWILSPTIGGAPTALADPTHWAAWQLHDPEAEAGCVTVLRRPNATTPSLSLGLRGLEDQGQYNVSWTGVPAMGGSQTFRIARSQTMAGDKLASLAVELEPSTSVVVRYTKVV
jgi:hypothetical protein